VATSLLPTDVEQVKNKTRMLSEEFVLHALAWRGVEPEDACPECDGSGKITYGSTATYRGGIGGQALTLDICNKCWGSGDRFRHWPSRTQVHLHKPHRSDDPD